MVACTVVLCRNREFFVQHLSGPQCPGVPTTKTMATRSQFPICLSNKEADPGGGLRGLLAHPFGIFQTYLATHVYPFFIPKIIL